MNKLTNEEIEDLKRLGFSEDGMPFHLYKMTTEEKKQYIYKLKHEPKWVILKALDPFWALTFRDWLKWKYLKCKRKIKENVVYILYFLVCLISAIWLLKSL